MWDRGLEAAWGSGRDPGGGERRARGRVSPRRAGVPQPALVRPQATLPLSLGLVWAGVGPVRSACQRLAPLRGSWRPSQRAPAPLLGQDQALCHVRGTVGQVAACSPLLDILKGLSPSLRQSPVSPSPGGWSEEAWRAEWGLCWAGDCRLRAALTGNKAHGRRGTSLLRSFWPVSLSHHWVPIPGPCRATACLSCSLG